MIKIIEQEISFDDDLKKKLEFICDFCNTTPTFINGSIRKIDKTNLSYIEPHRITSDNNYLKSELNKWKKRFLNIINFIKNRLLRPKDKEKYKEFTIDLYTHNALDQETFDDIRNNYSKDKRKDDYEL